MKDNESSGFKFAQPLLSDQTYVAILKNRLNTGILAPSLERRLWEYVYGRPVERVEVDDNRSSQYADMSKVQLAERARELSELANLLAGLSSDKTTVLDKGGNGKPVN